MPKKKVATSSMRAARGKRRATINRATKEVRVDVTLVLDGTGDASAKTGIPFFDHMLEQLGKHAGFDLTVRAQGDLEVDAHHTVEDTGLAIGEAISAALGDRSGIARFGSAEAQWCRRSVIRAEYSPSARFGRR